MNIYQKMSAITQEISDILGKNRRSCYAAWRRWNDKQDSMRGFFNELDNSGRGD